MQYGVNVSITVDCETIKSEVLVWYFSLYLTCSIHPFQCEQNVASHICLGAHR